MKKVYLSIMISCVFMIMSTLCVYANDDVIVDETVVQSGETEEMLATENIIETESVLETVIETETETVFEVEVRTLTEQMLDAPLTENGKVNEELDTYALQSISSLDPLDKNSNIVPFGLEYTFYYAEAQKLLGLVNQIRADAGVQPLKWDLRLEEDACVRAAECAILFSHTRPNGQPWSSVDSMVDAENIAAGYRTAEEVVAAWVKSPGHYQNLINPYLDSLGVGLAYVSDARYGYYWAMELSGLDGDGQCIVAVSDTKNLIIEAVADDATCAIRDFVLRLYELVLGRKADLEGLSDWFSRLYFGTNTGAEVSYGFFFSNEFVNQNLSDEEFIDVLYATMFDRMGDLPGKQSWLEVLKLGFSREYVLKGFVESQEYTHLCDTYGIVRGNVTLHENRDLNAGITRFVSRLYSKALGRSPEKKGLNDWTGLILNGQYTPEQVAFGFFFSEEMKAKNLNDEEFVKVLYRVFLDREADASGLADWTYYLECGMKREAVMYGISKSVEFGNILKSFGLSQTKGILVYVISKGTEYHKASCSLADRSKIPVLIQDAKSIGYTKCQMCY